MDTVGIRELRQHASRYVQAASLGAVITVTDRGAPVARLTPLSPLEQHLSAQLAAHALVPPVRPRRRYAADARLAGEPLTPLLAEDRAERLT
ncbi:MAG TPA: type II toxin-antitoxin system prevent-host-death family antitoxin [Intrasporangium sp.]|uniref:type II toxin-antitoxin system Phd/YefM family antitoxin n=1 Tax=Intrasporangium sp. TaxID=1925024 RepID=UPI002D7887EA|nr:type II toxin-antitoxin system prevent-host-death family antitoxin [Intrasporangium sp.]HET7398152.1 type II toxin-antitoxin system prevent-host-death family antitoxin [Intrasporangium sp.]